MSDYQAAFFIVPTRILNLPDLTFAFLRFYETVFQFWNHGKNCYLTNEVLKERTGIKSIATIQEAFQYFANHNEMKRITKNGKRYIVQPEKAIETDDKDILDDAQSTQPECAKGIATAIGGYRPADTQGIAPAIHKNKKFNKKNINKSFCASDNAQVTDAQSHFDQFWSIYPKKKDKKRSLKIWIRDGLDSKLELILINLKNQVQFECQWKEKQYIPDPSTYLNGERWNDEITKEQPKIAHAQAQSQQNVRTPQLRDFTLERIQREQNGENAHGSETTSNHSRGSGVRKNTDYLL